MATCCWPKDYSQEGRRETEVPTAMTDDVTVVGDGRVNAAVILAARTLWRDNQHDTQSSLSSL